MYAVVVSDHAMQVGKAASQAGHAYLGAFLKSKSTDGPYRLQAEDYELLEPGTKVCLSGSLDRVLRTKAHADSLGVPNFLVVDSGCENFNGGLPTVTALGIGPLTKEQAKPIVGKYRLL